MRTTLATLRLSVLPNARLWAWLFITLIPIMAGLYSALGSGSFYDSNLAREPGTEADAGRIEAMLSADIDRRYTRSWRQHGVRSHFMLPPKVLAVTPGPGPQAELAFLVVSIFESSGKPYASIVSQWFKTVLEGVSVKIVGTPEQRPIYSVVETGPRGVDLPSQTRGPVPASDIFPATTVEAIKGRRLGPAPTGPVLIVSPQEAATLAAFDQAEAGDPSAASRLFVRMLYFSATTITTLGIGDIQPISEAARTAVMTEAIAGILLAGLFLNALALRARATRSF